MKKTIIIGLAIFAIFFLFRERGSGPIVSQNGISTHQLADNILSKYDQNSDGQLDVTDESFLEIEIENVRKVESRGLLFTDADAFGNSDGSVSSAELEVYLSEFDINRDDELTTFTNIFNSLFKGKSEWAKFDDQYGERYKYYE